MAHATVRDLIRGADRAAPEEQWTVLCYLAGQGVELDEAERRAALRRAELLLATGGDPRRPLELYGRAVSALAADLDAPAARAQLHRGLGELTRETAGLRGADEGVRLLLSDGDLAWQCFSCALLADALAGGG